MNKNLAKMLLIPSVFLAVAAIVKLVQTGDAYFVLPLTFAILPITAFTVCLVRKPRHV